LFSLIATFSLLEGLSCGDTNIKNLKNKIVINV